MGCARRESADRTGEGFWWPEEPVSAAERLKEIETKLSRVRQFLRDEGIGGLLIGRAENFAWISAGGDGGGRALLFIRDDARRFLITDQDQARRLIAEDLNGLECEARTVPWYQAGAESPPVRAAVEELSGGRPYGSDIPCDNARSVDSAMRRLRSPLTIPEITRYRWLGKTCAQIVGDVSRRIRPGMTERGVEAMILSDLARHAIRAVEIRVAADGRLSRHGDAPPSDNAKVERFVQIGLRARRWGLDAALTRAVSFGPLSAETRRELQAAASVCAGLWARTLPGAEAGTLLQGTIADYASAGFADGWKEVDQGGAIGYGGWDWLAAPGSRESVLDGQTFAWHPEIRGVRMEDTILLLGENLEVLTQIEDWPVVEARALGRVYRLPGILIR